MQVPEACGVITRSMAKKLQQNNDCQQVTIPMIRIDTNTRKTATKKRKLQKKQHAVTKKRKTTKNLQKVTVKNDDLSLDTAIVLPPSYTKIVDSIEIERLPQSQTKNSEPVQDNDTELMSLNLNKYDSDSDEYVYESSRIVTNWVLRREYDSKHAKHPSLFDLFCTGPCKPKIDEIFNEVTAQQRLRNSSIWED